MRRDIRGAFFDFTPRFRIVACYAEQFPRLCEVGGTIAVGEQPVMADAMEPLGKSVDQEAADVRVLALANVAAESRGPTALDRRHDFQLFKRDVSTVGMTPRGTEITKDIRNLQI